MTTATNIKEFPVPEAPYRIEPLGPRVLVWRDAEEKEYNVTTAQGAKLVKADVATEKPLKGTVTAVGTDVRRVKVGDRVVFGRFSGLDLPEELELGKDLVMLKEDEILGRVWDLAVATA